MKVMTALQLLGRYVFLSGAFEIAWGIFNILWGLKTNHNELIYIGMGIMGLGMLRALRARSECRRS